VPVLKECELDTVLGLSMTSTAVGLVLVEGHEADGEIMDQDAFDIPTRRGATAISSSDYVAGALSRTRAIARGRRPSAIGVTWSDGSELEASLFLKSLTEAGYQNIVAVRSPEAGEALARGIGRAVGYRQTSVCLLEPETIVVSVVNTEDGAVQTVEHPENDIGDGLTRWLTEVFDRNDWVPECLIVVGPDAGLNGFTPRLERALGIPVFAPAEAEFALARGAALASAQGPDATAATAGSTSRRGRPRSVAHTTALTMLVGGTATFVASVCLAAGLKLTSASNETRTSTPPAATPTASTTLAVPPAPALPSVPPVDPSPVEVAGVPEQPPDAPQPEDAQEAVGTPLGDAPAPDQAPVDNAPAADAVPPPAAEPPPPDAAAPPTVPPSGDAKPPLLTRVLSHAPGLHPDPEPPAGTPTAP
jgi:hypothetical protein